MRCSYVANQPPPSRSPRFPAPAARSEPLSTPSRVGGRHHLRSNIPRLHAPVWRSWTGQDARCSPGGSPAPWTRSSSSRRSERRWNAAVSRRSSTPTRSPSLPASPSLRFLRTTTSLSAWTVEANARKNLRRKAVVDDQELISLPARV